jgi:hypothetical protein
LLLPLFNILARGVNLKVDHDRVLRLRFIIWRVGKFILIKVVRVIVDLKRYRRIIRIGGSGFGVFIGTFYSFSTFSNSIIKFYQLD